MKTTINICCEDKRELLMHLDVIKEVLVAQYNDIEKELNDYNNLGVKFELEDSNCYGTHTLIIKEEQKNENNK